RRAIAARYAAGIRSPLVELPPVPAGSASVWHLHPVLVDDRDGFQRHLAAHGVQSAVHYPVLTSRQPALQGSGHTVALTALPQAERMAACEVSLPIHPQLSDDGVERVVEACNAWGA